MTISLAVDHSQDLYTKSANEQHRCVCIMTRLVAWRLARDVYEDPWNFYISMRVKEE